jgi:hypothetical protein
MKVKVKMPFVDKDTKKVRNTGDVFKCTVDRYSAIKNYVDIVEQPQTEPVAE